MDTGVQIRIGDEVIVVLEGAQPAEIERILTMIDGTRDREELIDEVGPERSALIDGLLAELAREELLVPERDRRRQGGTTGPVVVVGHAPMIEVVAQALIEVEADVELSEIDELDKLDENSTTPSMVICAVERPHLTLLERCNARAIELGVPALFVNLSHGEHATVGPLYVPGDGACYRCWHRRLLENTASLEEQLAFDDAQRREGDALEGVALAHGARLWVAGIVALETRAFFSGHRPIQTLNGALTVDFIDLRTWREPCWRVPWCDACGR